MARNTINMILWHPDMKNTETKITYIHRGIPGNIKTINADSITKIERGFLVLKEGTEIPVHRIIKITNNNNILWKK